MSAVSLRALARSSAYVNAATVWQMASRLVLTPVIITTLGVDGYGAWALIFSLCSYAMALDNAAGWVYAKLTAELDQQGDYTSLSEGSAQAWSWWAVRRSRAWWCCGLRAGGSCRSSVCRLRCCWKPRPRLACLLWRSHSKRVPAVSSMFWPDCNGWIWSTGS